MAWIESNQELARHPKSIKAARVLGISVPALVGHLHFIWWWCLKYAQDGDLSRFDVSDIADAAGWEGDAEQFVTALINCGPGDSIGFIEQTDLGLAIHDWMNYAGRLIEKRQANTKRMQNARAKHMLSTDGICAPHVQGLPYPTVPNPTVPYTTVPNLNIIDDVIPREGELDFETSETEPVNLKLVAKRLPDDSIPIGTQAVDWAEKNWGRMIPKGDADSIVAWCDEFSTSGSEDPDAVVIEGLKYCLDADVRNVKYLRAVLTDWRESGIQSVGQIKAREAEHINQRKRRRNKDLGDKTRSVKTESSKYDKFYLRSPST